MQIAHTDQIVYHQITWWVAQLLSTVYVLTSVLNVFLV